MRICDRIDQQRGKYTSLVVVQHHPMIQRKTDRYVKVVCDFQTSNRTISNSYNVMGHVWASTALVNATSTAPQIKLRITDKFGGDITGAKLGDELYLRIEAETESIFDMVARSVLAKSGTTEESIMLIDKDGCPTDLRIFPSLKKLDKRTLIGKFDAFKFSSDVVVRFQVDVQFCLHQCPQVICEQPTSNSLFHTNTNVLLDQSNTGDLSPAPTLTTANSNNNNMTSTTISGINGGSTVPDLHEATMGPTTRPPLNHMLNMTLSPQSLNEVHNLDSLVNNHGHHNHMSIIPTPGALEQQEAAQLLDNFQHDMLPSASISTPMLTSNSNGFMHDGSNSNQQQQQQQAVSLMTDSLLSNTRQLDGGQNSNQLLNGKQQEQAVNGNNKLRQSHIIDNNNNNISKRRRKRQDSGDSSPESWNHHQIEITSRPNGNNNFANNGGSPRLKTDYALHREIIVESGPSPASKTPADSSKGQQQVKQHSKHHHTMTSSSSNPVNIQSSSQTTQQQSKHNNNRQQQHQHQQHHQSAYATDPSLGDNLAEGDYSRRK